MNDTIYRQEALDHIRKRLIEAANNNVGFKCDAGAVFEDIAQDRLKTWLKEVPTADPGLDEWCTDCKEYDQKRHSCPRWNRVIRETLNDMPERKTGKWINYFHVPINKSLSLKRNKDLYWACSNCGYMSLYINTDITYNFCPCCGADMRGEHDE